MRFYFHVQIMKQDASAKMADVVFEGEKMYSLKTTADFDSAHFLKGYNGKCSNIHGHRWVIEAEISGASLQQDGEKRGMLIDFSDLKKAVKQLADRYDHTLIIEQNSLKENTLNALKEENFKITEVPFRPTAENFAKYFFDCLKQSVPVSCVTVYETPQNAASYKEEN